MKILFVDDEKIIRENIRQIIDWERLGCTQLTIVESASRAIEELKKTEYDLVISDIVMQKMNGIELAKHIRAFRANTRVIILSAYEDFSMARGAIQAGVIQYLLKPVDPHELEQAIAHAGKEITENKRLHDEIWESEKKVNLYRNVVTERIWWELLNATVTDNTRLREMIKISDFSHFSGKVACLLLAFRGISEADIHGIALRVLPSMLGYTAMREGECAIILSEDCGADRLEQLKAELNCLNADAVRVVCGKYVDDLFELRASYEDALRKMTLYTAMHLDSPRQQLEYECELRSDPMLEHILRDVIIAAQYGSKNLRRKIETYYDHLDSYDGEKAKSLLEGRLLLSIYEMVDNDKADVPGYESILRRYLLITEQKARIAMIVDFVERYCKREGNAANDQRSIVESIRAYIDENYTYPLLTVGTVADTFFISSAYLSRIFRKRYGQTCISYITNLRIDYAKSLLENANMKIADIATKAGYSNVYYFSVQFKKATGETPGEYRRRTASENESNFYT